MTDPTQFFLIIGVVILALTVHEFAHAYFADMAGDPTPRYYGRVTLNPLAHLDPLGTVLIIFTVLAGFGIGFGKPVPVDPRKMNNPRWDHFVSVAAGPLSNLLQAILFAAVFRIMQPDPSSLTGILCLYGVLINLSLFLFNLIPFGPLDGHWLVGAFMPEAMRDRWYLWNRRVGTFLILGLVLFGQFFRGTPLDIIGTVLRPAAGFFERLLLGQSLR